MNLCLMLARERGDMGIRDQVSADSGFDKQASQSRHVLRAAIQWR